MSKYARDVTALRKAAPEKALLTCHDEYLLASMVQGVDGALVGFASFIPDKITALFRAVQRGDLKEAMRLQLEINPLKESVYGLGEPTGDAHSRMKTAMMLAGRFRSNRVRAPIRPPQGPELEQIRRALDDAGMLMKQAAE
jgi:4-hydroxy-tetrahydrodipicolinate synthase